MKKIFNFVVIFSVFIGGLFLNSNQIFINSSIGRDNLENVSLSDESATEVSTAEGFMNAANNGENILLMNDIDFSEIDSDQTILENYTGTINGNGHSISNHNFSSSEDSNATYLFESFNGVLENIDLDNFPFFAKKFIIDEDNSNQAQISNVIFENIDISSQHFTNEDSISNLGLFFGSIINTSSEQTPINFEQILINDINFTNNILDFGNSNSSADLNLGLFSGEIVGGGTIDQLAIENINFNSNEINNNSVNVLNLGMFSGKVLGLSITNSFIDEINITNNSLHSTSISMGSFIGDFEQLKDISSNSSFFYANNLNLSENNFYYSSADLYIGSLLGKLNFNDNNGFKSFILEEPTLESNYSYYLDQDIPNEYNIGEVSGNLNTNYFDSNSSYIVTSKTDNLENEFQYIDETTLDTAFWENNGFDPSIWDLDNLYLLSTNLNKESYGYPLLLFLSNIETTVPTFTLTTTNDFEEVSIDNPLYDDPLKINKILTFNLTLNNPNNFTNIFVDDKDQTVLTLHSSFYDLDGQNYKEITFNDFLNSDYSTENKLTYNVNIYSFIQTKEQLNNYYWIEINDEFSINYTEDNQSTSSNSNIINLDKFSSSLTNTKPVQLEYDTTQNLVLDVNTTYNLETNELTFYLSELENYDYDFYYNLNLTLNSTTETKDIHLDSNNNSQTVKLNENLPNNLSKKKSINDFYTINLKQSNSIDLNDSSYVVYLDEAGIPQIKYMNDISNQKLKEISSSVYLEGDLTNTNLSSTLENISDIETKNNKLIIIISILLALILLIILIYLIIHYKNKRNKKTISHS